MGNYNRIHLIILLFFCSSSILSTLAVPSSRSMISNQNKLHSSSHVLVSQAEIQVGIDYGWVKETGKIEGRMGIELEDYPGPGANPNHEPKKPGSGG